MFLENKEAEVLRILGANRQGLFGNEILEISKAQKGQLTAFNVYTVLESLVLAGSVQEEVLAHEGGSLPRYKHHITENGIRVLSMLKGPSPIQMHFENKVV